MGVQPGRHSCVAWRKSRHSADQGNCVEIADRLASVLVRDSKDPSGPHLALSVRQWRQLLERIRTDQSNYG
jgi:Domain of unknown function (DUF397)